MDEHARIAVSASITAVIVTAELALAAVAMPIGWPDVPPPRVQTRGRDPAGGRA